MSEAESKAESELPTIYVGKKPLMNYVIAAMTQFMSQGADKIRVVARGRAISRAVDVAEVLRTRYLPGIVDVESVKIGTDQIQNPQNPERIDRVSTIEIVIIKKRELIPAPKSEE